MRNLVAALGALMLLGLALPAARAADTAGGADWTPEMEQAYQGMLHPGGPRATGVLYFVDDKKAAADYYSQLLGFPFEFDEPNGPTFLMVDEQVSLGLLDVHQFGPPNWKAGDPMPSAMLSYQVEDAEAEAAKLQAGGATVMPVHDAGYVTVYVAIDAKYHNAFSFMQLKDSPEMRMMFKDMDMKMEMDHGQGGMGVGGGMGGN